MWCITTFQTLSFSVEPVQLSPFDDECFGYLTTETHPPRLSLLLELSNPDTKLDLHKIQVTTQTNLPPIRTK
ncbi:MAG: hypothetical protein WA919_04940 [Coleofasciculaceae cyanobacterium]